MNLCLLYNNNNNKKIIDLIDKINNIDIYFFLITPINEINNFINILSNKFDNYADITNNNNLLILYNTICNKIIYRIITNEYILIIIDSTLLILINEINKKLINIIKKLIILSIKNNIVISKIFVNTITDKLNNYLIKLSNDIIIIKEFKIIE